MILDADILIELLRQNPKAEAWLASLPEAPALSGIAVLEALFGSQNATELKTVEVFVADFEIALPSEGDYLAAQQMAKFHLSDGIDLLDSLSAAIALSSDRPLATFNTKYFRAIPGLAILQPYTR
jgi:tRNA(fMet)-specific endonuclease VapC